MESGGHTLRPWVCGLAAIVLLAATAAQPGAQAQPVSDQDLWYRNNIEPGADRRISLDGDGATFLRRVGTTPLIVTARRTGYRNVWVRFEAVVPVRRGPASYYSTLAMKSYDCPQHRVRATTTLYYAEHNLTGRTETANRTSEWIYIAAGTPDAAILEIACGRAQPTR